MAARTIISYDGTPNDADALTLARVLGEGGSQLLLAYVRHRPDGSDHEHAQALLERGAASLDGLAVETRVVVHASTSEGLAELAGAEHAELIVFGSDYRTPAGRVAPQPTAQKLLDGGRTSIAIAPAGYHERPIRTIGLLAGLDDTAAIDTAHSLASHFAADVTDRNYGIDLLIVGSRREARAGHTLLSGQAENAIVGTTAPVLVVARGVPFELGSELYIA